MQAAAGGHCLGVAVPSIPESPSGQPNTKVSTVRRPTAVFLMSISLSFSPSLSPFPSPLFLSLRPIFHSLFALTRQGRRHVPVLIKMEVISSRNATCDGRTDRGRLQMSSACSLARSLARCTHRSREWTLFWEEREREETTFCIFSSTSAFFLPSFLPRRRFDPPSLTHSRSVWPRIITSV